jgi:NHL repeat
VVTGGGTGAEVCTVAASCKGGDFGGLGAEFASPADIAGDASGNLYVTDRGNNRVQKFDSSGTFLRAWGRDVDQTGGTGFEICTAAASCKAGVLGGLGGELQGPKGIATDAAGNAFVANGNNHRIDKFDSAGNFLLAWGKDVVAGGGTGFEVCSTSTGCQTGSTGSLGGELFFVDGVAVDAVGIVYTIEDGNNRIQRFDSTGTWQRAWGKDVVTGGGTGFEICTAAASCKAGAVGGLGGEFDISNPFGGVAVDGAGAVYAADDNNHRIQKFAADPVPPPPPGTAPTAAPTGQRAAAIKKCKKKFPGKAKAKKRKKCIKKAKKLPV